MPLIQGLVLSTRSLQKHRSKGLPILRVKRPRPGPKLRVKLSTDCTLSSMVLNAIGVSFNAGRLSRSNTLSPKQSPNTSQDQVGDACILKEVPA